MYMGNCNVYQVLKNLGYPIDSRITEIHRWAAKEKEKEKTKKKKEAVLW